MTLANAVSSSGSTGASTPTTAVPPLSRKWTLQETALLKEAVAKHGEKGQWDAVAADVPFRSADECEHRWETHAKVKRGKWSKEEDNLLLVAFNELASAFWSKVSESITGRSGQQCMARYTETLDPTVKKGKWSSKEDVLLRKAYGEFGKTWVKIAEMIPGRTQRQCRTRWVMMRRAEVAR
ncbi:Homeodomain-like protein, partial [Entophlyctis helioformis]